MNETSFVERREPDWKRITLLCDKAESTPAALTDSELSEFIRLYRNVSSDLALVRTQSSNEPLMLYLNDLAGRAYGLLYTAERKPLGKSLAGAIATAAQTVRRRKWFILTSALLFFGSGLFLYGLLTVRPDLRQNVIVDTGMEDAFKEWTQGSLPKRSSSDSIAAWGMYASNNPMVAISGGAISASTFGLGTVYILVENGQVIGTLSFEMARVGKLGFLWVSIMPHGVPELSGLVISGAAGLCMGWALINPGRKRRGEALLEAGKDAITLLATSVVMMLIAAPIEGFFSFSSSVPTAAKLSVIIVELIVWGVFWTGYAKEPAPLTPTSLN